MVSHLNININKNSLNGYDTVTSSHKDKHRKPLNSRVDKLKSTYANVNSSKDFVQRIKCIWGQSQ